MELFKSANNYRTHKIIGLTVSDVEAVSSVASSGRAAPIMAAALTDKSSLLEEADATYVGRSQNDSGLSTITFASVDNVTQSKKNGKIEKYETNTADDWSAEKTSGNKVENAKSLGEIIADIQHDFGLNILSGDNKACIVKA